MFCYYLVRNHMNEWIKYKSLFETEKLFIFRICIDIIILLQGLDYVNKMD